MTPETRPERERSRTRQPLADEDGLRLHGVHEGQLYCSVDRTVFVEQGAGELEPVGRLPLPEALRERLAYSLLTTPPWRTAVRRLLGAVTAVNVWPLSPDDLVATVGPTLSTSSDGGATWQTRRGLPDSSGPMGVLPTALCSRSGTVYLGEYPLDTGATPRILRSTDAGRSWSTTVSLPDVRHVHAVQHDPYTDELWVTTGDTDAESRIYRLRDGTLDVVGGGSQRWRAVELAFTPRAILWGMDCPYAERKWIFRLPREDVGTETPTPEPVHRVPGAVYYSATLAVDDELWVVFSTGLASGPDSTGPEQQSVQSGRSVVVASSSATGYEEWYELESYRRSPCVADYVPGARVPSANAYVFLAADSDRGVFVNPSNTDSENGGIYCLPPERFEGL